MARYLLDTDALIDHLKGYAPSIELIRSLQRDGHTLGICCIGLAELYSGLTPRDRHAAAELADALAYFEVTQNAAQRAGAYRYDYARKGMQLSSTDATTAATALEHGAVLVTGNTSHYPMEDLAVLKLPRR